MTETSNINFQEISSNFLNFLIHKCKNKSENNFGFPIIYQLLENEPSLKENSNIIISENIENLNDTHENEVLYYKNQLLDIIEVEFNNVNNNSHSIDFPLLQKFENPFPYFQKGLPSKPYYKTISYIIYQWNKIKQIPYQFIDQDMPNEINEYSKIKTELNKSINELNLNLSNSINDRKDIYWNFFEKLNISDLLVLLGERITLGSSKEILPPSINDCIKAFIEVHPKDKKCKKFGGLTVGARALSKHCHRDQTNKWWGNYTGNTFNKNNLAICILIKLLKSISWINIHKLPHDINVYEIRNIHGYGARWYFKLDSNNLNRINNENDIGNINIKYDIEFRGFLEPQDINGHEKKWRH